MSDLVDFPAYFCQTSPAFWPPQTRHPLACGLRYTGTKWRGQSLFSTFLFWLRTGHSRSLRSAPPLPSPSCLSRRRLLLSPEVFWAFFKRTSKVPFSHSYSGRVRGRRLCGPKDYFGQVERQLNMSSSGNLRVRTLRWKRLSFTTGLPL